MSVIDLPLRVMFLSDSMEHIAHMLRGAGPLSVLEHAGFVKFVIYSWPGAKYDDVDNFYKIASAGEPAKADPDGWLPKFSDDFVRDLTATDVILIPQVGCSGWYTQFRLWKEMGKTIILDIDDDVFAVHPFNDCFRARGVENVNIADKTGKSPVRDKNGVPVIPFWRDKDETEDFVKMGWKEGDPNWRTFDSVRNQKFQALVRHGYQNCDAIFTTTARAAERFKEFTPHTFTLPNSLEIDYCYRPGRHPGRGDGFRVAWFGGNSHISDVHVASKGLARFINETPDAQAIIVGTLPPNAIREIEDQGRVEFYDWIHHTGHPWRLQSLGIDLGWCAVEPGTAFNACKSPLKWTEFGALGIPSICTDAPPYSDAVRHGKDGWLVPDDEEAWYLAFKKFYEDRELLRRVGAAVRERVEQDFDVTRNAKLWLDAMVSVLRMKRAAATKVEAA